jgi:serine/threonine protein kinase
VFTTSAGDPSVQKEVEAIKQLCGSDRHENIVQVLNHGSLSHSPYYFIDMELCDLTLYEYIHPQTDSGPMVTKADWLSVVEIYNVTRQIAAGLEYIHRKGHVHRDLKPQNGDFCCVL